VNVQDYIASGIIESCVLGMATDEEHREFERMCAQYPEVLQARDKFELSLETAAMNAAVAPPADLKKSISAAIASGSSETPVIPMSGAGLSPMVKYFAIAASLLLAISLFWNVTLLNKNTKLAVEREREANRLTQTESRLAMLEKDLKMIQQNPAVKMAAMKGLEAAPGAFATVYWDTTSHDVYLLANNLPVPASDKQYQLWALLDGKPIDMGVIDNSYFVSQEKLLIRGKNVRQAQAFAITLEDKGGNPTPKGKMYVLGNL
jgi:anti-sigma-K factor RskA